MTAVSRMCVGVALAVVACAPPRSGPPLDRLAQPTGFAVGPDGALALVSNGNWTDEYLDGTLMLVDLVSLHERIDGGQCRDVDGQTRCSIADVSDPDATVRPGTGLGNIVLDRPAGADGPLRALLPVRTPNSVTWVDVVTEGGQPRLSCGQGDDRVCSEDNRVRAGGPDGALRLPGEPGRIELDDQGFRFLYVPHVAGGNLSLIALDGDRGPQLSDVESEFFTPTQDVTGDLAGGFAVAQRACDPEDPPLASRECSRPLLYTSQRYAPSVRAFTVAPGLELILPGGDTAVQSLDPSLVQARPFMGDVAFEDPATGERLLAVQTTPAALFRLDMTLDDTGRPRVEVLDAVALCANPNVLAIDRPEDAPGQALVGCFSEGEVAVVDLATFRIVGMVQVGEGASEIAIDPVRRVAYVTATADDQVAIISLDRGRADYLRVRAFLDNG